MLYPQHSRTSPQHCHALCSASPAPATLPEAGVCLPRGFPRQPKSPGLLTGTGRAEECEPGRRTHSSFPLPASARSRQPYYNAAFCALQSIRTRARLSSPARAYSPEAPRAESVINQAAASIQDTHAPVCCAGNERLAFHLNTCSGQAAALTRRAALPPE